MPFSRDGAERLAAALREVTDHVEQPVTVWRWNTEVGQECRGTLYGWQRINGDRVGLVVTRRWRNALGVLVDVVEWVPEKLIRRRGE